MREDLLVTILVIRDCGPGDHTRIDSFCYLRHSDNAPSWRGKNTARSHSPGVVEMDRLVVRGCDRLGQIVQVDGFTGRCGLLLVLVRGTVEGLGLLAVVHGHHGQIRAKGSHARGDAAAEQHVFRKLQPHLLGVETGTLGHLHVPTELAQGVPDDQAILHAQLDVYTTGVGSQRNTNAVVTVVSVDFANKTINVSGNATDLSAIVATDDIVFKGSATNDMVGLKKIVSATSGTIFGINTATYELWRGVSHSVGGQLTFGEVMDGLAKAQAQGGLDETAVLMVSSRTWAKLNSDQAALRDYDKSYESAKSEIGSQAIKFWGSFGQLEVIGHPYIKEGEGISVPKSKVRRIGVNDIGFVETDAGGVFERLEGSAGYQVLSKVNASIFVDCPAQCVYFSGITN